MGLIGQYELEPPTNRDYFSIFIKSRLLDLLRDPKFVGFACRNEYLIETDPASDVVNGFSLRMEGQPTLKDEQINLILSLVNQENGKVAVIPKK